MIFYDYYLIIFLIKNKQWVYYYEKHTREKYTLCLIVMLKLLNILKVSYDSNQFLCYLYNEIIYSLKKNRP